MDPLGAEVLPIVLLSLRVSGTAVAISTVLGVPAGAWIGLARFRAKGAVAAAIYTLMALPPVVVGLVLYVLLSNRGPLGSLGVLFTPAAMILAQTVLTLPYVVGVTMTAVEAIPEDLMLQLRSLGAGRWQVRRTVLREARLGVLLAVAMALGRSISEVGAVLLVGGNIRGHTRVLTTTIVLETSKGQFALALTLGAVLMTLALAINVVILRLQRGPLIP